MDALSGYRGLTIWQKSKDVALKIYKATDALPKEERYGLTSQMRRAAISIPSNIAEGYQRGHRKEYIQFLSIALGSAAELETQIAICKEIPTFSLLNFSEVDPVLQEVIKILIVMIRKLGTNPVP
jgi:four helix bundle protein